MAPAETGFDDLSHSFASGVDDPCSILQRKPIPYLDSSSALWTVPRARDRAR